MYKQRINYDLRIDDYDESSNLYLRIKFNDRTHLAIYVQVY